MKKVYYILSISLLCIASLSAQLPAIGGPRTLCSQAYKYRVKTVIEQRSDTPARYTHTYDVFGYLTNLKITTDFPVDNEQTNYIYNEKKQLVEVNNQRGVNFEIDEGKSTYEYDEQGRLNKSSYYAWVPENEEYAEVSKTTYMYEGTSSLPNKIEFQKRNLITQALDIFKFELTYNEKDQVKKIIVKLFDGSVFRDQTISYDAKGRLSRIHTILNTQQEGKIESDKVYNYAENGNILQAGAGDFINYFEYNDSFKGEETYFPCQLADIFVASLGSIESSFFLFVIPHEGLAHQLTKVQSTNGADTEPILQYELEYEENKNVGIIPVLPQGVGCTICNEDGIPFLSAPAELMNNHYFVYDLSGSLLSQGIISSEKTSLGNIPRGAHVVFVGGVAYKVVL